MANLTGTRTKSATLAAGVVDVVTLDAGYPLVEVANRSTTDDLWFTVDRTSSSGAQVPVTPAVGGDGSYYVGPGGARSVVDDTLPTYPQRTAPVPSVVRVVSAAAVPYTVTGLLTV